MSYARDCDRNAPNTTKLPRNLKNFKKCMDLGFGVQPSTKLKIVYTNSIKNQLCSFWWVLSRKCVLPEGLAKEHPGII